MVRRVSVRMSLDNICQIGRVLRTQDAAIRRVISLIVRSKYMQTLSNRMSLKQYAVSCGIIVSAVCSGQSWAQCEMAWRNPSWLTGAAGNGNVTSLVTYDPGDGTGPRTVVATDNTSTFNGCATSTGWLMQVGPRWVPIECFGNVPYKQNSNNGNTYTQCVWDPDGASGPMRPVLVASGGSFGSDPSIVVFDGITTRTLPLLGGGSTSSKIRQFATYRRPQDQFPRLYACGNFNGSTGVGRLNSGQTAFDTVGGPGDVAEAMLVFDDGTSAGEQLYVAAHGVNFADPAGTRGMANIARYNGAWSSIGGGLPGVHTVLGLVAFDYNLAPNGRNELVAISDNAVHIWNGSAWSTLALSGYDTATHALSGSGVVFDDGTGEALYLGAGASFQYEEVPTTKVFRVRPNTGTIEPVPGAVGMYGVGGDADRGGPIYYDHPVSVFVHDFGAGQQLIASGTFALPNEYWFPRRLYAWTNAGWSEPGAAPRPLHPSLVFDSVSHDPDGDGPESSKLFVCGVAGTNFVSTGDAVERVGSVGVWDGNAWSYQGEGLAFTAADGTRRAMTFRLASGMLNGVSTLIAMATVNEGGGVVSAFRYNSGEWIELTPEQQFFGDVMPIFARLNGIDMLTLIGPGEPVRFNGAGWDPLGSEIIPSFFRPDAEVFTDASGTSIFVSDIGLDSVNVMRYDGMNWTPASDGLPSVENSKFRYELTVAGSHLVASLVAINVEAGYSNLSPLPIYLWNDTAWVSTGLEATNLLVPVGGITIDAHDIVVYAGASSSAPRRYRHTEVWEYDVTASTFTHSVRFGDVNNSHAVALAFGQRYAFTVSSVKPYSVAGVNGVCFTGIFSGVGLASCGEDDGYNVLSGVPAMSIALYECASPACIADYDTSGAVSVDDIFTFLGDWFVQALRANINGRDGVTVDDIFDFLAAWFTGCN